MKDIKIGMGATVWHYSDRTAGTIISISKNKKQILVQEDFAIRTDGNGMSECQTYTYKPNASGNIFKCTLRKNCYYAVSKTNEIVTTDIRLQYHDYSF